METTLWKDHQHFTSHARSIFRGELHSTVHHSETRFDISEDAPKYYKRNFRPSPLMTWFPLGKIHTWLTTQTVYVHGYIFIINQQCIL